MVSKQPVAGRALASPGWAGPGAYVTGVDELLREPPPRTRCCHHGVPSKGLWEWGALHRHEIERTEDDDGLWDHKMTSSMLSSLHDALGYPELSSRIWRQLQGSQFFWDGNSVG